MIKCYKALLSGNDYMGMHNVDEAALDHPQILASIIQAVVTLEELLSSSSSTAASASASAAGSIDTTDDAPILLERMEYTSTVIIQNNNNHTDDDKRRKEPDPATGGECQTLRRLATSLAMSDCLYDGVGKSNYVPTIGNNKHFVRALQTAKKWTRIGMYRP
jgi:hypothetical protein